MSDFKEFWSFLPFRIFTIFSFSIVIFIVLTVIFTFIYMVVSSEIESNYIDEFYNENNERIRKISFDNFSKKLSVIRINIETIDDKKYNIEIETGRRFGDNDTTLYDNLQLNSIKKSNEINEIIKQKEIKPNTLCALKMIDTLIFQSNNEKMYQIKSIYLSRDSEDSTFACQFIMYDGFLDDLGQLSLVYTQSDYKKVKYYGYGRKNRMEEYDNHFFSNVLGFRD